MLTSSTTTVSEPLTLNKLRDAMKLVADLPPPPFFGSSKHLPADAALTFTHERRQYAGAHPDFWAKLPKGTMETSNPLTAIVLHNLDVDAGRREEFFGAMRAATLAFLGERPLTG